MRELRDAQQAVHVASVIADRLDGFEPFPCESNWEDTIVCGSIKRNRDGSLTIACQINVDGDGHSWETFRKIRLKYRR
jgi:hypothetical protein